MEEWKNGRGGRGRMEEWKRGRMEEGKNGRGEGWIEVLLRYEIKETFHRERRPISVGVVYSSAVVCIINYKF